MRTTQWAVIVTFVTHEDILIFMYTKSYWVIFWNISKKNLQKRPGQGRKHGHLAHPEALKLHVELQK